MKNNTTKQNVSTFEKGSVKSSNEVDFSKWKLVLIVVVLIIIFHFVSADLCSEYKRVRRYGNN